MGSLHRLFPHREDAGQRASWIDRADALHSELKSRGVEITRDVCNQPYGCRDFDVEDCNGYRLCFGEDLEKD